MIIRHAAGYLLARGVPGVINVLALSLFTHMLSPEEYGGYALVVSAVSLCNVLFFQWLRLGLLRYLPAHSANPVSFLSTLVSIFISMTLLIIILGLGLFILWPDQKIKTLIGLGLIILCLQAAFEATLELKRSQLKSLQYGILSSVKAMLSLCIGGTLTYFGFGVKGILAGLALGFLLPLLVVIWSAWVRVCSFQIDRVIFTKVLVYGIPLSATFVLDYVVSSSDRLLLGWLLATNSAGIYSAGYDLSFQSIVLLMSVVNLAAYPLAVRALEKDGVEGAQKQLLANGTLLFSVGMPISIGMAILASNIAYVFFGAQFQVASEALIPWISISALLAGIKGFHFDLSFQLGQKTICQVWIVCVSALLNILLNLWLIPMIGIMGAAYATFASYAVGLVLSWYFGQYIFLVPMPWLELFKIGIATLGMICVLLPMQYLNGWKALFSQILAGGLAYVFIAFITDVGGCRNKMLHRKTNVAS